jgi:hypothetical protein
VLSFPRNRKYDGKRTDDAAKKLHDNDLIIHDF